MTDARELLIQTDKMLVQLQRSLLALHASQQLAGEAYCLRGQALPEKE